MVSQAPDATRKCERHVRSPQGCHFLLTIGNTSGDGGFFISEIGSHRNHNPEDSEAVFFGHQNIS